MVYRSRRFTSIKPAPGQHLLFAAMQYDLSVRIFVGGVSLEVLPPWKIEKCIILEVLPPEYCSRQWGGLCPDSSWSSNNQNAAAEVEY